LQDIFGKYDRDKVGYDLVDQHMIAAGYAKNGDGFYAKDGAVLKVPVRGLIAPPLTQQLIKAGFDPVDNIEPAGSTA